MNCPYCGELMQPGHLRCDRSIPLWYGDDERIRKSDRFLGRIGQLKSAISNGWGLIRVPGHYCHRCEKLIIDTQLEK